MCRKIQPLRTIFKRMIFIKKPLHKMSPGESYNIECKRKEKSFLKNWWIFHVHVCILINSTELDVWKVYEVVKIFGALFYFFFLFCLQIIKLEHFEKVSLGKKEPNIVWGGLLYSCSTKQIQTIYVKDLKEHF